MSSDYSEPFETMVLLRRPIRLDDIGREKRLLRRAIATTRGKHRIRLQRELAALEEYERRERQRYQEFNLMT